MMVINKVLYKIIVFNCKLGKGKCYENIENCLSQQSDKCSRCEHGYTASNFKYKCKRIHHAC